MADITKYAPINGGTLISDFKSHFSMFRAKRTVATAYGAVFVFIAFTVFFAFGPSPNASSPWFANVITVANTSSSPSSSSFLSDDSYRSHFSSILYFIYPNGSSSSEAQDSSPTDDGDSNFLQRNSSSAMEKQPLDEEKFHEDEAVKANQSAITAGISADTSINVNSSVNSASAVKNVTVIGEKQTLDEDKFHKDDAVKANQSAIAAADTSIKSVNYASEVKNVTAIGEKGIAENSSVKNLTSSSMKKKQKKKGNGTAKLIRGLDGVIKSLLNCDFFDGNWVRDESYPLYAPGSCTLIDEQFNCFFNRRPDDGYYKLKWKPKSCTLPRLNGNHMLELLRGKRLVFVGDSLNRNMWESLICILRNSVKDQKKVYEAHGKQSFRSEASYSFVFEDYKLTVEFFVTPFLVQEWEVADKNGTKKETLRLDLISKFADQYKDADFIVYNTGHWWTHDKTSLGKDYYQEGSHVYKELNVEEAFRKAMTTWGRWIDAKVNLRKSLVFFRGYSASHFSGGQWNSGGQCDNETEPITNDAYLSQYPSKMSILEQVMKGMKTRVTYMNVTKLTDYRKDGHPSIYRKQHSFDLMIQDCSHWCLPGVPDTWNEILYAELLVKLYERQQLKKKALVHT